MFKQRLVLAVVTFWFILLLKTEASLIDNIKQKASKVKNAVKEKTVATKDKIVKKKPNETASKNFPKTY